MISSVLEPSTMFFVTHDHVTYDRCVTVMCNIMLIPNFKFKRTIAKYSNLSTLEPNHISWRHLKVVVDDNKCLFNIVNITNIYINLSYWLLHFKMSTLIIIPKLNKALYDFPKMFHPIILLNTLEKLNEKVIREKLQYQSIAFNFLHSNQLGGLK